MVSYYRDDKCLDEGTGDDPVPRPWPGEASTDQRVKDGYVAAAGGPPPTYEQLTCDQKQGVWGAHGIHYFFSNDTDNAASPEVLTEIDSQQWQFMVPTATPTNVGMPHADVVIAPLLASALPLVSLPSLLPPSAADGTVTTDQDVGVQATLSAIDLDTCELTFAIVTPPAHGTLDPIAPRPCSAGLPNGDTASVTYTPATGFSGSDSFTYTASDGTMVSAPATIQVNVKPRNPPLCATGPESGCRHPVPGSGRLVVRDATSDARDKLSWRWVHGPTTRTDFGDPLTDTRYQLCVYDGQGRRIASATAPASGDCGGRPCWRATGSGFRYLTRAPTAGAGPRSRLRLSLRADRSGRGKIVLRGTGVQLGLAPLPAAPPITVQLKHSDDECWEATYSVPARRNDTGRFADRGD